MNRQTDDDRIAQTVKIEPLEFADLSKHQHGDRVLCPCCGFPATLDTADDVISFDNSCWHNGDGWQCYLMIGK